MSFYMHVNNYRVFTFFEVNAKKTLEIAVNQQGNCACLPATPGSNLNARPKTTISLGLTSPLNKMPTSESGYFFACANAVCLSLQILSNFFMSMLRRPNFELEKALFSGGQARIIYIVRTMQVWNDVFIFRERISTIGDRTLVSLGMAGSRMADLDMGRG